MRIFYPDSAARECAHHILQTLPPCLRPPSFKTRSPVSVRRPRRRRRHEPPDPTTADYPSPDILILVDWKPWRLRRSDRSMVLAPVEETVRGRLRYESTPMLIRFAALLILVLLTMLSGNAAFADDATSPRNWQINGFAAALNDPHRDTALSALRDLHAASLFRATGSTPGALGEHTKDQASVLVTFLSDKDEQVRAAAAHALGALGKHAEQHARMLVERLSDKDEDVRKAAAGALGAIGEHAKEQKPVLVELLSSGDDDVREAAAQALGALGEHAKHQAPALAERLNDEARWVRRAAARALGALGEHAKQQAPMLAQRLNDEYWRVGAAAAQALGSLGEHAKDQVPTLVKVLSHGNSDVHADIIQALGALGEHAKDQAPALAKLLSHADPEVQLAAAQALGALGEHAKDQAPALAKLLSHTDPKVQVAAAHALGALGDHARHQALALAEQLNHEDDVVRIAAVQALGALGEFGVQYAPKLASLLRDDNNYREVRVAAAQALGALAVHAKHYVPSLIQRLGDRGYEGVVAVAALRALVDLKVVLTEQQVMPLFEQLTDSIYDDVGDATAQALANFSGDVAAKQAKIMAAHLGDERWWVRAGAVRSLLALGKHAKQHAPALATRLGDEVDSIRTNTAYALGTLGEHATPHAHALAARLSDNHWRVRVAAAQALGALGENARHHAPALAARLRDRPWQVPVAAAQALGRLAEHAELQAPLLADRLNDENEEVRRAATQALRKIGPFPVTFLPSILIHRYYDVSRTGEIRFIAHFLGGGSREGEMLLHWLAAPKSTPLDALKGNHPKALETLALFERVWPTTNPYPLLRNDLADQIGRVVNSVDWTHENVNLLRGLENDLRIAEFIPEADAILKKLPTSESTNLMVSSIAVLIGHALFWLLLIFAYPRSALVQTIFFWNRWVRIMAGLGYIGFLLTWVPFLRRQLFAPFKDSLLADARIAEFEEESYYKNSLVRLQDGELRHLAESLSQIRGQIILEGESGLGKTMFLRHLVKNYRGLIVFLYATDCNIGVLEAIQVKLKGAARDPSYLRNLIYAGALDIVIDGLNEASVDTRAKIIEFSKHFAKGNLLLVTQPMMWDPPPLSKIYFMQWLTETQIEEFLISRFPTLSANSEIEEDSFGIRCRKFTRSAISGSQSKNKLDAVRHVLSNPMDLTVVAQMLARDQTPNLFELQRQYFRLMADDYERRIPGHVSFPLMDLANHVYNLRIEDRFVFFGDEFVEELAAMARHKMVVPYFQLISGSSSRPHWMFRHDKIMDFFLVQAFLGKTNDRPGKHFGDPRFRGTYLQMANLLPLDEAESLERQLVDYAADTKDHSVSDDFIQLLRSRRAA